ncbi:MAG: hypothetical protein HYW34_01270 [Candidatus Brennerbacteria bacterium]|nr:hypothetical protein [Candidatus Brennerbacteria bacterium]
MEMEKPLKFINANRQDKIFIDRPLRKEIRRIQTSVLNEICVEIGRGKAVAFAARKTKILRPQKRNGRFVFEHCDSGVVVQYAAFGYWLVYLRFDNDDHISLVINCDLAKRLEELRLPKLFSNCVKTAMRFNANVKKLTPLRLQMTQV